jgi:hypothetical protein
MTAPTISATPKKALDQRATSRHDNAVSAIRCRRIWATRVCAFRRCCPVRQRRGFGTSRATRRRRHYRSPCRRKMQSMLRLPGSTQARMSHSGSSRGRCVDRLGSRPSPDLEEVRKRQASPALRRARARRLRSPPRTPGSLRRTHATTLGVRPAPRTHRPIGKLRFGRLARSSVVS